MTTNKQPTSRIGLTSDEAAILLDAMESVHEPLHGWTEHEQMCRRLRDLITRLDG